MTDTFLGRTADGTRVYARARLTWHAGGYTTTDHASIAGYWEFAATFALIEKGRRTVHTAGQIPKAERLVYTLAPGVSRYLVSRLYALHDDWHLNGITAACVHMPSLPDIEAAAHAAGATNVQYWALDNVVCPVTGYRYGHAWLVRVMPERVLSDARAVTEELGRLA